MRSAYWQSFWLVTDFSVASVAQPSGCVHSRKSTSRVNNRMRFSTWGLLIMYAWNLVSWGALVGLHSADFVSRFSACSRTCEITSLQSRRVMWGCFCYILLREQIGGLMYKWTLRVLWSERPCIVKRLIDAVLCEDWEGKIRGCDFVSKLQKFEFCVDLSTCQGVCLVSHPPF